MSTIDEQREVSAAPSPTILRDGDVYRWRYRDDAKRSYHCCSCIGIVKDGILRDTYWQIGSSFSEGKWFAAESLPTLELTRLGNLDEFVKVPDYFEDYYDDADVMNLNHANSSRDNFYIRKGAKRSQSKMLEVARSRLEDSLSAERMAAWKSQRIRESIARIESGDTETLF
jgi:hypothetical protein